MISLSKTKIKLKNCPLSKDLDFLVFHKNKTSYLHGCNLALHWLLSHRAGDFPQLLHW